MRKWINLKLDDRTYPILIENNILSNCGKWIKTNSASNHFVILSVAPVFKTHGKLLLTGLKKKGAGVHTILIPDGENQKNEYTLFKILKKMAQLKLQRDSCLITFGGGVVGDLGGFAASIYMRGIDLIQCPTTFLAQVDASIGGKTAIDFAGIKNLIGSFYQPKIVLIDPSLLKTLTERQFRTGLAEVIKYGAIQDKDMFLKIEKNLPAILKRESKLLFSLISRSCEIKAKIVSEDEREKGKRAWLNYGHTLGHALESYFHYESLNHGEAISYGMWFASMLSTRMGLCSESVAQRQYDLLKRAGLIRKLPPFNLQKVCEKMFLDKKARNGKIQFVLTRKIGLVTIQKNIPYSTILSALTQLQAEAGRQI